MKIVTLILVVIGLLSGCASAPKVIMKHIPDGDWKTLEATINGKFSSTVVTGKDFHKLGNTIYARDLHIRHSNQWMTLVEIQVGGFEPPTLISNSNVQPFTYSIHDVSINP